MLEAFLFWIFAPVAVLGALSVVLQRSIIYAALSLIVVFLSIAAVFILNNADFLAIAQTIVYAVGLTIILLFGVMFTGERTVAEDQPLSSPQKLGYLVVVLMTGGLLIRGLMYPFAIQTRSPQSIAILQQEGSTRLLANELFVNQVLPFELASILLLVAMVGAIVLAKKRFPDEPELPVNGDSMPTLVATHPEADETLPSDTRRPVSV